MEGNLDKLGTLVANIGFPITAYLLLYLRQEQIMRKLVDVISSLKEQVAILTYAIQHQEKGD